MNERIKELNLQAMSVIMNGTNPDGDVEKMYIPAEFTKKFAELIVKDTINIMNQEWYDWNNAPKVEGETPRGVGIRVGAKSQTIRLMHMIKKHFGVE